MAQNLFPIQREELAQVVNGTNGVAHARAGEGLSWPRLFGEGDPYNAIAWERREARITKGDGKVVFEQKDIEVPSFWSQTAIDITASKYFRGKIGTPVRETSVRQMVDRVADTIAGWGLKGNYFKTPEDQQNFLYDLRFLLVNQYAAFNSPVWFNVGVYEKPQCSACFILAVEDNMESILNWYRDEGWIFKFGSGSGINLSPLRSSKESISRGGKPSGPVSFMKGADGVANSIRSGGTTRRAAKMVVLNVDHPDIKDFIYCKKNIEEMTRILEASGIKNSITGDLFDPYTLLPFQNANNSVRVTDEFMQAVENDADWDLKAVATGATVEKLKAREIMHWISEAAWHSADPGMQYDTTINDWHTVPNSGRINASNPCSEYMHLDNSACNLASINLLKFLRPDGVFDIALYKKTIETILTAQEIIVGNSSYPTPKITENAMAFRELGLGYANLGALLMNLGLAYDSDEGRVISGALTAILCGEGYAQSARIAEQTGPFSGYPKNRDAMLNVIKKHGLAAENLSQSYHSLRSLYGATMPSGNGNGNGNGHAAHTVVNAYTGQIVSQHIPSSNGLPPVLNEPWIKDLVDTGVQVWKDAHALGEQFGYRNSQATVLAPTGTISFLMDCDTTGIEPELALVKYKKLVGGGVLKLVNNQVPPALHRLGYTEQQIKDISAYLIEKETIEGAPHLKDEHVSVFDCSFKATNGTRSISHLGHIKMMAAAQPFISGAISKTVNLPTDATVEDVHDVYMQSWRLGLKAVAVYRDGSKSVQPMSTSDGEKKNTRLVEHANGYTRIKLPDERPAITHKFSIGNHEGYLNVGIYPDTGNVGEMFITIAKEGSTVSGLLDVVATLVSMCLQSGIPLKTLVKKFKDMRFEPSGITSNQNIPFAKSFIDYIFRYIGLKFLSPEDREELFGPDHGAAPTTHEVAEKAMSFMQAQPSSSAAGVATLTVSGFDSSKESHTDAPICECGTIMFRAGSCFSCPNCFATTGVCN